MVESFLADVVPDGVPVRSVSHRSRHGDNRVRVYFAVAVVAALTVFSVSKLTQPRTFTHVVSVPARELGLHHVVGLDAVLVMGTLTRYCDVWANFNPSPNTLFKAGQRYVAECSIVVSKKGPKA